MRSGEGVDKRYRGTRSRKKLQKTTKKGERTTRIVAAVLCRCWWWSDCILSAANAFKAFTEKNIGLKFGRIYTAVLKKAFDNVSAGYDMYVARERIRRQLR